MTHLNQKVVLDLNQHCCMTEILDFGVGTAAHIYIRDSLESDFAGLFIKMIPIPSPVPLCADCNSPRGLWIDKLSKNCDVKKFY